jgi:hypothetical protein
MDSEMVCASEQREIYEKVLRVLDSSAGFDAIAATMDALPKLEVYLAGGAVRDVLVSQEPISKDLDFFLGGQDVESALSHLERRGELLTGPFGSPRWFPNADRQFYCDLVPIRRFHNGLWQCEDITDVLNQFDFTANALAVDLRCGQFYNPQNGHRDLLRRIMRAVRFDYPEEPMARGARITRPAVVWFRILHYAAALNLTIEPVTMAWLKNHSRFLQQAAAFENLIFPLHQEALEPLTSLNP